MRAFVGVTDQDWYELLSAVEDLDEVNFWQPSGSTQFRALSPGELFLFKLHSPHNFIVGGAIFAHFSLAPVSLAWDSFQIKNGARSLGEMRTRIEKYRKKRANRFDNYTIGCILLEQPFFFPRELWIPVPGDWKPNIVRGKGYDLTVQPGRALLQRVEAALQGLRAQPVVPHPSTGEPRFGLPTVVLPRLGQGSFRVIVTDAYKRRCAVTGEKVLPALEAAHIKPYSEGGEHRVDNGLLLRRDLHSLFDQGYVTISTDYDLEISRRIREEFENGRDYYKLHGSRIRLPAEAGARPAAEFLDWHNGAVFRA